MKLLCAVNPRYNLLDVFDIFYEEYCKHNNLTPHLVSSEYFDLIFSFFETYIRDESKFPTLSWQQYLSLLPFRKNFICIVNTEYGSGYKYGFTDKQLKDIKLPTPYELRDTFLNLSFEEVIMEIQGYILLDGYTRNNPMTYFTFIPKKVKNELISNIN